MRIFLTLCLLSWLAAPPAFAQGPRCPVPGEVIQWMADYCMLKLETDDEIAAGACIQQQRRAMPKNSCEAKRRMKRDWCRLSISRGVQPRGVDACVSDRSRMGNTVRNNGVGR